MIRFRHVRVRVITRSLLILLLLIVIVSGVLTRGRVIRLLGTVI